MTSYFDRHEVLLDSAFQDFIAHEVRPGLCEGLPDNLNLFIRQSVLQRHLIGEGSHRRLASSIEFHIDEESSSWLPIESCEVLIIERLPSGVFADPFELQHLHQRGGNYYSIHDKSWNPIEEPCFIFFERLISFIGFLLQFLRI